MSDNQLVSETELDYVATNFVDLRQQYAGMWIAVVGETVVAAAASAGKLRDLLDAMDVGVPFVKRIPAWGEVAPAFPSLWALSK